jgi:hypothetical protein
MMKLRIKYLLFGVLLASAVTVWAAVTNLGRLKLSDTPEITGSNSETISNATNNVWAFNGRLDVTANTPEFTGTNDETISNATNGTWDFGAAHLTTTGKANADDSIKTAKAFYVDQAPILKTMVFGHLDSLSQAAATWPAVITLESDITVLRAQVATRNNVATAACAVVFFSGSNRDSVSVASGAATGSNTTDVSFSAADVCSLKVVPGASATGGIAPVVTLQFTDKSD